MTHCNISVSEVRKRALLPEWASEFTILTKYLAGRGLIDAISARLRVPRSGYAGIDILSFLLAFFCWGHRPNLSTFAERSNGYGKRLAALVGRARWPGQSSVSRLLASLSRVDDLQAFSDWLLLQGGDGSKLLSDPLALERDAMGCRLAVFDLDPTVIAVRRRALPEGDELPKPRRLSDRLCAPGYSGRKRGETQVSLTPLQSAGTALWLHSGIEAGNASMAACSEGAMTAIGPWLQGAGLLPSESVMRIDGAGGHSFALRPMIRRAMHVLVRLARYHLLETDEIRALIANGEWVEVPDAGSGPKRFALDIGSYLLDTAESGDPEDVEVRLRIVLTRFARDDKHGAGIIIDGWQYEMLGTTLTAAAWPAASLAELYFRRATIENRFAQQGRDLHLGRVLSYEPAGQLFATVVAMWVSNLRIWLGKELSGGLGKPQPQPRRDRTTDVARCLEVANSDVLADANTNAAAAAAAVAAAEAPSVSVADDAGFTTTPSLAETCDPLLARVPAQVLEQTLHCRPGWTLSDTGLRCPQSHVAQFRRIQRTKNLPYAQYSVGSLHCAPCAQRAICTNSRDLGYTPPASIPLIRLEQAGDDILELARAAADHRKGVRPAPVQRLANQEPPIPPPPRWTAPSAIGTGEHQPMPAELLPTGLRDHWFAATRDCLAEVHLRLDPPAPKVAPWHASHSRIRQRRRQTWAERLERLALRGEVRLELMARSNQAASSLRFLLEVPVAA